MENYTIQIKFYNANMKLYNTDEIYTIQMRNYAI